MKEAKTYKSIKSESKTGKSLGDLDGLNSIRMAIQPRNLESLNQLKLKLIVLVERWLMI